MSCVGGQLLMSFPPYITAILFGDLGHKAEVVRDQDDGQPVQSAQRRQQIREARLDDHVQRGGGLVGDQDVRVSSARASPIMMRCRILPGELVGVLLQAFCSRCRGSASSFSTSASAFSLGMDGSW